MRNKIATSFRLTEVTLQTIRSLSKELSISQADVVGISVRNMAKREGVHVQSDPNCIREERHSV